MVNQWMEEKRKKYKSIINSIEKRHNSKSGMSQEMQKIHESGAFSDLKQSTVSRYLSDYTFIHEIRKFDPSEIKKALNYQLTYELTNKESCEADACCRALPYRKKFCYLHWILKKREKDE